MKVPCPNLENGMMGNAVLSRPAEPGIPETPARIASIVGGASQEEQRNSWISVFGAPHINVRGDHDGKDDG
jgi:hypothetical protein